MGTFGHPPPSILLSYIQPEVPGGLYLEHAMDDLNGRADSRAGSCLHFGHQHRNAGGELVPTDLLEAGKFNSPHGMAVDGLGNIYVSEWLIGGRYTKLARS